MVDEWCDAVSYFLYSNRYSLNASASIPFLVSFFVVFSLSNNMKWHYFAFRSRNINPQHSPTNTLTFISYTFKLLHDSGRLSFAELAGTIQASIQYMRIWCSNEYSSTTNNDAVFRNAETKMNICVSCEWVANGNIVWVRLSFSFVRLSSYSSHLFFCYTIVCAYVT